ncbi:hypothetical protein [Streptomyces sp. NPDC056169]|uniref:hypothetical protein n=1 Tax=Streptomyces sp. NPDC056169 TaxID=3345734 RepID=UPI0035DD7F57
MTDTIEDLKLDYTRACKTIADMHAAAIGRNDLGPIRGVVEDVADIRAAMLQAEEQRDAIYRERAHLVALLATHYPSHIGYTDPDAPDWAVLIIEAPGCQLSWHIAPRDMDLFGHVRATSVISRAWDGHTTDQKYERIRTLTARRAAGIHLMTVPLTTPKES